MFSTLFLIIYIIAAGWTAGFYTMRRSGEKSLYITSRKFSPCTAAFSTLDSDICIWIVILPFFAVSSSFGLPAAYSACAAAVTGFAIAWYTEAQKIRIYNEISEPSATVPSFLSKRFKDSSGTVKVCFGIIGCVFCMLYAAALLGFAAELLHWIFGINRAVCVLIAAIIAAAYSACGFEGITAAGAAKTFLTALILGIALFCIYGKNLSSGNFIKTFTYAFENIHIKNSGTWFKVLFASGWGIFMLGSPALIRRFMTLRERRAVGSARRTAVTAAVTGIFLTATVCTFISEGGQITEAGTHAAYSYIYTFFKYPAIQAFIATGAFMMFIHTAAVQIHTSASMFSEDLKKIMPPIKFLKKDSLNKDKVFSLIVTTAAAAAAYLCRNSADLLIYSLSCIAAAFAPTVIGSLYTTAITAKAASASAVCGTVAATVFAILFADNKSGLFGASPVLPAFAIACAVLACVSVMTKNEHEKEIINEYNRVNLIKKCKGRFF